MMQNQNSIDDKSFACEICWRRFARENDLKTHLWVHTQSEKHYSCDLCHRAFPCLNSRNNHFKRTHKDVNLGSSSIISSSQNQQSSQTQNHLQPQQSTPQQQQTQLSTSSQQSLQSPNSGNNHVHRKNSPPCDVCGKTFAFKYYVKIHQTVHTREKPFQCEQCRKCFSQASSRNRHRKEMHKEGGVFEDSSNNGLQQALAAAAAAVGAEGAEKMVSHFDVLGKQSFRGALYEVHPVPEATKEKPYSCDLCHKRFTQASSRNRHLKEMHKDGDTPLPMGANMGGRKSVGVLTRNVGPACEICGKRFPCKSLLEIHGRVHTKERPFSCCHCGKTFTQVSSRNFHQRKMHKDIIQSPLSSPLSSPHSGSLSFPSSAIVSNSTPQSSNHQGGGLLASPQQQLTIKQTSLVECGGKMVPQCGVCGKRFPCKSLMDIHMRTHTKERPYACCHCGKTFTQSLGQLTSNPMTSVSLTPQQSPPQPANQLSNMNENSEKQFHCKMCAAGGFPYK